MPNEVCHVLSVLPPSPAITKAALSSRWSESQPGVYEARKSPTGRASLPPTVSKARSVTYAAPVLARLGLQLASWTRRGFDTVNGDATAVLARLTRSLAAGDIVLLHDGHAARSRAGVPVILEVLPRLLDAVAARALEPVTLRGSLAAGA